MTRFKIATASAALALATFAGAATASDGLAARTVDALGASIASQGNAALAQIRAELKDTLLERLRPWLPARQDTEARPTDGDTAESRQ